jgi:1,4-alpha-glucan branching enzyme
MGSEFGQSSEWRHDGSLDWHLLEFLDHEGIRRLVRDLNRFYHEELALHATDFDSGAFRWINCTDADSSTISFLREHAATNNSIVAVGNYTPVVRTGYRVGLPRAGYWREAINTDSEYYGGSNVGNAGGVTAEPVPCDGLPYSAVITLPSVSTLMFKWSDGEAEAPASLPASPPTAKKKRPPRPRSPKKKSSG